jgi:hypothetical protein
VVFSGIFFLAATVVCKLGVSPSHLSKVCTPFRYLFEVKILAFSHKNEGGNAPFFSTCETRFRWLLEFVKMERQPSHIESASRNSLNSDSSNLKRIQAVDGFQTIFRHSNT